MAFYVYRFSEKTTTDIYLRGLLTDQEPQLILDRIDYSLAFLSTEHRLLALTNRNAPNQRIVELPTPNHAESEWLEVIPETDTPISNCLVGEDTLIVSYTRPTNSQVLVFDFSGRKLAEIPVHAQETATTVAISSDGKEVFLETQSFSDPIHIYRVPIETRERIPWTSQAGALKSYSFDSEQVWFMSKDGTPIPMFLVGRPSVLQSGTHPVIMTSYGGYGVCLTPKFSVLVAFLMDRGCLFALPGIRGGSEFGETWHSAAKRRNRQKAFDDFLSAAEWLIASGRTTADRLAIFGGSNSGLLVGAAMTQRPDLFRAVLCMVPLLDMIRYHLFDASFTSLDELGSADNPEDLAVLAKYSPYHLVSDGTAYPATMLVSGDADGNCNPLHARKMTARLQAANSSGLPVILDYTVFRGHSPVLPLSERIEALTDRLAFLCDQLGLSVE
jgi:prolyl oligopeptidase